jgi:hypothetical protein
MNQIEDNYLQKFYRRNTNLTELTAIKNVTHKSSFYFFELGQKEIFFLWIASNILLYHTF